MPRRSASLMSCCASWPSPERSKTACEAARETAERALGWPHVRNRGIRGPSERPGGGGLRPEAVGVPRLRLGRCGHRRRWRSGCAEEGRQAAEPAGAAGHRAAAGQRYRDRAYPVGDARRSDRRQRTPPCQRGRIGGRDPQRHHRELRTTARSAAGGRCHAVQRNRYRGRRPPAGAGVAADRRGAGGGDAARLSAVGGGLHAGRSGCPGAGCRGRCPAQLAAGGRSGRGRSLPGLRRCRVHRAHPGGHRARPGPGGRTAGRIG
jgi:hypothetical protein